MQTTCISQAVTREVIATMKMSVLSHFLWFVTILLYFVTIKWIRFPLNIRSHLHLGTCWERYKVQIAILAVNLRLDRRGLRLSLESTVNRESFSLIAERYFAKVASYNTRITIFVFLCSSFFLNWFSIILETVQSFGIQIITFITKSINIRS